MDTNKDLQQDLEKQNKREKIRSNNNEYDMLPLKSLIKSDIGKYRSFRHATMSIGFYVVLGYRFAHFFYKKKIGWLGLPFQALITVLTFCKINRKATIGPGLVLHHPTSIYVGPHVSIGRDCNMGPRTFLSNIYHPEKTTNWPVLGDGISIAVGVVIMGQITIEEAVIIAPNVVVMKDITEFHNVLSSPARSMLRTVNNWE